MESITTLKYKGWDALTLKKIKQIRQILNDFGEDEYNRNLYLIACLADCNVQDILKVKLTTLQKLIKLSKFIEKPMDINVDMNQKPPKEITLNGKKYRVNLDFTTYQYQQFVDFQLWIRDTDAMGELMSTILIPEGKEYGEGYDIREVIDDIYNYMTFPQYNFFFSIILIQLKALYLTTREFLEQKKPIFKKKMMKNKEKEVKP